MRILFIGADRIKGNRGVEDSMESHIVHALGELSVECTYFAYRDEPFGSRGNRLLDRVKTDFRWIQRTPADFLLVKATRSARPDIVLVLLGNYTSPGTIQRVRDATGAPVVCWCQDHMGTMGRQYLVGSDYDYIFAKDQQLVDLLQRYTDLQQVRYLPEACNPLIHRPTSPTEQEQKVFGCEVTTAATLYYFRARILEAISDFNLKIWGALPRYYDGRLRERHMGRGVYAHEKAACFNAAKIVINTLHPMEIDGLNARAFEIAGCGGFQMITDADAVSRHFEPGREIETFHDLKELREKVRYYLDHEEERLAIAQGGVRRAHSEHTYTSRLKEILDTVFPSH